MQNPTEYIPTSAMSIQAHPDDQEFTVAGTLARWARAGCQVVSVIVTSGDAGSNASDKGADYKPELARIREGEQRAANELLGLQETVFLGFPDGELVASIELRKALTRLIRQHRPEVVLTGDPTRVFYGSEYTNHPDHRAAAEAAIYATFPSAGSRLIFADLLAEGLEPHNVKKLYLWGAEQRHVWVDISDTIELKCQALKKHASQLGDWNPTSMIRDWATETGRERNMAFAEAFRVMVLVEDELPEAYG